MRLLSVAFLLIAVNVSAQQPAPPRFRAGAEVIAIDVTVIDPNGNPVADLAAGDFTVTVEGQPRAIQSAQFLRSEPAPRFVSRPDESTNSDAASGRLLLIVTDDASLRPGSHGVVEAAAAMLDHLGPGDLVGVAHIPDGGGVPFTTDRARVINELKRVRPATPRMLGTSAVVYLSEALDFDGSQRVQWPAAIARECAAEADTPVFRLCMLNLEQTARALLIDESIRTNTTIRGLEQLMKRLEPTGQPVTLVLISGSLVIARDPAALEGLAAACAAARITLHVVQPAPPTVEMTSRGFPSDPTTDTQLQAEGLELMAARTRGAFHRAVGTGATLFNQIGRELAGYYLLGIEPAAEDGRQPRRRVDVKVRRAGVTVRARSMFALDRPTEPSTDDTVRLRQMLEASVPVRGVPIRMTARTVSGDADRVRVLIAAEIGEPTDQRARYHVGLIAIDAEGAVKARSAAATSLAPARAGRQSPSLFTTSLLLDPGEYSFRLAAIDETGRSGSVHHGLRAAMREWPRGWRTSDLIVANQPAADEFPPFNASSIVDTASVAVVLELRHDEAAALNQATVRFEVDGEVVEGRGTAVSNAQPYMRSFASLIVPAGSGEHQLKATVAAPGVEPFVIERSFTHEPALPGWLDPVVTRPLIEALENRLPTSPSLAAFVTQAKAGAFVPAPDADTRSDGDLAMVTFVGGLAALREDKPALARALFQQTLRKAPGFEGALFYLERLK